MDALYHGLKKVGCRVIWSLKNFKLPEENPNFWVSTWIPQIEVLAHPAVKAGLTHCGHGGTLEFIAAGLPIVAWPHFGDQHDNGDLIGETKIGIVLFNKMRFESLTEKMLSYYDPVFDAQKVYEVFNEILSNEIYSHNMKKL